MNSTPLVNIPLDDEQFLALALRHLDGIAEPAEEAALVELLRDDADHRRRFVTLCRQIGMLHETHLSESEQWSDISGQWPVVSGQGVESRESRVESWADDADFPNPRTPNPEPPIIHPQIPSLNSRLSTLNSWAFSYAVATLLLGIALLGAWFHTITHPDANSLFANSNKSTTSVTGENEKPQLVFVGRVSGMVDCQFADATTETVAGAGVSLGRRYALRSGLMEIEYDSGAKVILQGPCDYTIESPSSGFLQVGKLVAKVESQESRVESKAESGKRKAEYSRLSTLNSRLFAVRTPTAMVEDLGTEFGVEVLESGETASHVFQGRVVMRAEGRGERGEGRGTDDNKSEIINQKSEILLTAGQSARVERDAAGRNVALRHSNRQTQFVRELPARKESPDIVLISKLDYSDTWTLQTPARPGSYAPLESQEALQVEQCHGNPVRSWALSAPTAATTWPSGAMSMSWPGFVSRGIRSGFTERGGLDGVCYLGIEYGLRDDFIVQFDAVQTDDRINITIGDEPATIEADQGLSVFFRVPGGPHPEIGLYTSSKGEADSGLQSGIPAPFQWHNYAVRFNLKEKQLTVWVDGNCRGMIDLSRIDRGMNADESRTWADLPWTGQYVTIGGYTNTREGQVWTDNFRVGAPGNLKPEQPSITAKTP